MAPSCPMSGGNFRGPPVPLLLVPIVIQLVRSSCDPKITAYLKEISKGGPTAIAQNAHRIAQYALSKVPSNVLYWLTSKVLNLPPDTAMQTTEFLKSRTDFEILLGEKSSSCGTEGEPETTLVSSDLERRLEKLELQYQLLQEKHIESPRLLTFKSEEMEMPSQVPEELTQPQQIDAPVDVGSMELIHPESYHRDSPKSYAEPKVVLQDVGLRLGRIFLEWAGETMKRSLVTAASESSFNAAFAGAGVDLAGRLIDAVVT